MENQTTLNQLIARLERAKAKHGGDAIVGIEGHDEGEIAVEDNYDTEQYPDAKVLLVL